MIETQFFNGGVMRIEAIEKKIRDYVEFILFQHDLDIHRNNTNKKIYEKIVRKCMSDLENEELLKLFTNESQIECFVRQTVLYLVLE